jgi:serine/threonine-protein kinase
MTTPENPPVPVREGDVLDGKYRVERVLGAGGMGVVVAARHVQLEQRVALKFVLPSAMENAEVVERFSREARAAVRLKSEHVARVIDVGKLETGSPYIVMEYLEGHDLGDVIEQRGPLPPEDAITYLLQACEAIAEAHAIGIVHRDLKPRNLFLTSRVDGRPLVKVLDFGISKAPATGQELSLTKTTAVMGSPNYMSPEQLRSAKLVDGRTDIWALGIILYECLTGRVPFEAETVTQLCAMVLQDPPRPLEELRRDLPPGLSNVVSACLEKDPARRFQSIADLARALERFGGPASQGLAQRIATVGGSSTLRSPQSPSAGDSSGQRVAVTGGTSVAWGDTQLAPSTQKRPGLHAAAIAALALVGLLVIGASALAFWKAGVRMRAQAASSAELEQVPPVRQIELSPSPAEVAQPAPPIASAPVAPVAPVASVPMPVATHRDPLSHVPPARTVVRTPQGPTPPIPKPRTGDDMPDERN